MKKRYIALPLLALVLGAGWFLAQQNSSAQATYRTAVVDTGDITQSVAANGTLNPVTLVSVGTQISGTVIRLHADYNSKVKAGDLLAELDPALIESNIANLQASIRAARSNAALAKIKLDRARKLVDREFVVRNQLDEAQQTYDAATAQIAGLEAQLKKEQTNLGYTRIRAPIDGIVISRSVDLGQTVAASLQTPTLFQIARDLTQMQIDTAVAEADVGQVQVDMPVNYTVDAFPGKAFTASVKQIRLNPTIQQNVVTYNVVLAADNPDGLLMPGMTAQTRIVLSTREHVLRVPNAALRYKPDSANKNGASNAEARRANGNDTSDKSKGDERKGRDPQQVRDPHQARVYVLDANHQAQRRAIRTGVTDQSFTEVVEGLQAGDTVIVGEANSSKDAARAFNVRLF